MCSPVKKYLKINSLFLLLFCFWIGFGSAENKPQARINNPEFDFGYVPQKSKVSHVFYLHNTGTSPLTVLKIKSGCSCTSASKIEKPIPPGDSAAVNITFNSGRYHSKVGKTTTIFTDDPDSSVLFLEIFAEVQKKDEMVPGLNISPRKLEIQINDDGAITDFDSLEIINNGPDSIAVNIIDISKNIIENIIIPENIKPSEMISPSIEMNNTSLSEKTRGVSITFGFIGSDTTIVTVPIKIKK